MTVNYDVVERKLEFDTSNERLRPIISDDLELIFYWRNDETIRSFMFESSPISEVEHVDWFGKTIADDSRKALIFEKDGSPSGFIAFTRLRARGLWEWGFYAAPGSAPGTGTLLAQAGLKYAFLDLEAHKVCGRVLSFNNRSIHLHKKLGFRHEGTLRSQHDINGFWHDVHCFGVLRAEWKHAEELKL